MEKGVDFGDLEQFVIVPERPRLWDLKNPGWSVNKSKHNRFVITPNGYLLTIFTMLPILMIGIPLTFLGIVLFGEPTIPVEIAIVLGIIGILLLFLSLTVRQKEIFLDLDNGYFVWRFVNWPRFRTEKYKLYQPFNFKVKKNSRGVRNNNRMAGYDFVVMDENEKEIPLIFFRCDQNPNKEFPLIVKTLEDSIGMRRLFDGAENR